MGERFTLKETARQQKTRSLIHDQGGSVLLALLITMIIVSVLAAALLPTLFTSQMGQVSAGGAMKAYYLAEAGGRYTLPRLGEIPDGEHTFTSGGGDTFFIINKSSATEFTSTGVVFEGTSLESRVTITYKLSSGFFDYGIFGGEEVTFQGINYVDSDVGTNSDTINKNPFTYISGSEETLMGKDMTAQPLPSGASSWADITDDLDMSGSESFTLSAGEYSATGITISDMAILTISGDVTVYVSGPTQFSDWAQVRFEEGASLTLYAAGDVSFSDNSGTDYMVPVGEAQHFIIYGISGCDAITFSDFCDVSAGVYAPDANITMDDFSYLKGALVGETITMADLAHLVYDDSLQSVGDSSTTSSVVQYFTPD